MNNIEAYDTTSLLNWLHLTDLHCSESDQDWLWPIIKEAFFEDVEKLHERCGPWNLILFTGDLVYSGKEFTELNKILDDLYNHLRQLGSDPILLPVPGNHDLLRPIKNSSASDTAIRLRNDEKSRHTFWNDPNSHYQTVVNNAFENYISWRNRCKYIPKAGINKYSEKNPIAIAEFNPGYFPGDFTTTVTINNLKLGIAGLNTACFQLTGGDYKNRLEIHPIQFVKACNSPITDWKNKHDLCLLMTHHPEEWLTDSSKSRFHEYITPRLFFIHLFGHMHESRYVSSAISGASTQNYWQGRSLFGQGTWDKRGSKKERSFGYSAARIELSDNNNYKLRFWPRSAVQRETKNWEIDRDPAFSGLMNDEGTEPQTIKVKPKYPTLKPKKFLPCPDPDHLIAFLEPFDNPNERPEQSREEFVQILEQRIENQKTEYQQRDQAKNPHIIVVGSVCMDAFIEIEPTNISHVRKEKIISFPLGSKLIAKKITLFVGGGGANASITFARQGLSTALISRVGSDTRGYKIINWLHKNKIAFFGQVDRENGSGYSVILDTQMDDHTILAFKGSNDYLDKPKDWFSWYEPSSQQWLYSASMTGQSFEIQKELFKLAKRNQIKTIYNPSSYICETGLPLLEDMLHHTDILIVNKEGAKHLVGEGQLIYLAEQLTKTGPNTVAVTGDIDGVAIFQADSKQHVTIKPDPELKIIETTGAGDAFASGFITGLINQEGNLKKATLTGILNAERVIQTISANQNIPDYNEMTKMLNEELENPRHQINC